MRIICYSVLCFFALLACSPAKNDPKENVKPQIAEYALALDSAVKYIRRYDSVMHSALGDSIPVKSFTVRAVDLLESLGLPPDTQSKYENVRIYLGMDTNNKFRLFLTPVSGANIADGIAGKDIVLSGPYTNGVAGNTELTTFEGEYVLDFTGPCPTSCPDNDLLNQ